MNRHRPQIGYTTRDKFIDPLQYAIHFAIYISGGKAVRLHPKQPKFDQQIDGLIISGGTDLYPPLYDLDPKPDYEYDQLRDDMEQAWMRKADKENLPVLGICRGAQLMNVTRGGSLHVDISKVYENAKYPAHLLANIFYRKLMLIEPETLLGRLLGAEKMAVNSMHKQSIDRLGEGFIVSAKESNGIVQAVEDPERLFFVGVQYHPEVLIYRKTHRRLFKSLVDAAREGARDNQHG